MNQLIQQTDAMVKVAKSGAERRRFPRLDVSVPGKVGIDSQIVDARVVNASMGGLLLQVEAHAAPGDACRVWVETGYGRVFGLARVIRSFNGKLAVQFQGLSRQDEDRLAQLLAEAEWQPSPADEAIFDFLVAA